MVLAKPNLEKKSLILVYQPGRMDVSDFYAIAGKIRRRAEDIVVGIASVETNANYIPAYIWQSRAVTVSFGPLGRFSPPRGAIFKSKPIGKLEQAARFASAGLPTPRTAPLTPKLDLSTWGDFVVLKPLPLSQTSTGEHVRLMRTSRLQSLLRSNSIGQLMPSGAPVLVQQFIDTGPLPTHWRVLTLFGAPLYCMKFWCPIERPPLDAPDEAIESAIIETKHPSLKRKHGMLDMRALESTPEILSFATEVHDAFPTMPLLGIDILQDHATGNLFVIEINAGGNVWHFSSPRSALGRDHGMPLEQRVAQFGAWDVAANALIAITRKHAR